MDINQQHDEEGEQVGGDTGDLLVGAAAIKAFLVSLGWPENTDPYYLKRRGWPIGSAAAGGGKLIATERRLARHTRKLATS